MFRVFLAVFCATMSFHKIGTLAFMSVLRLPAIASYSTTSQRFSRLFASSAIPASAASDVTSKPSVNASPVDRLKVKKILESDDSILGKQVTVQGWVRTVRDQKKFSFIEINDGSTLTGIQAVAVAEIETYSEVEKFTTGAAVEVIGTVVASIGKGTQDIFLL
jgi:OB-fold nucleic acid binding domain